MRDTTAIDDRNSISPYSDRRLSATLLALWAAVTLWQRWDLWAEDLSAVYIAGWLWQSGQQGLIYATPPAFFGGVATSWFPAMEALGIADKTSFAYVYPPIWAVMTAPLTTLMSPQSFINAVAMVQMPLLAASVWLAGRIAKPTAMPWWVWTVIGLALLSFTVPAHSAIWQNQPSITVGFLALLAVERLGAGRPVAAGLALALAAAIKLLPAAFALVFLLDRQWRAAATFSIAGATLALLSVALAGWPAHQAFLASLAEVNGSALLGTVNISLRPAVLALGSALGWLPHPGSDLLLFVYRDEIPAWLAPAIALLAIAIVAAYGRALAGVRTETRRVVGFFALVILVPLMGTLGWQHYYVVPLLLLPGLTRFLPRVPALALIAGAIVPSLSMVFVGLGALPWPVANYIWIMCAAWLAILAGLYAAARRAAP